ncbi:DISARM system helicase DrmA [Streptomyces sp. JJ36]|uniref:DISARM system helicase DrmA n=1 Tax=Streptomyces sp. JJ36 TaxID=2736645 RepID=UPI001F1D8CE7|nr:DISARM system helicase DrmA [Streptomyces sp. JJ36]
MSNEPVKATGDVPAWQVPQEFAEASSYQVRDKLQQVIEDDLLGPWNGSLESFAPRASGPGDRYLVGKLGPREVAKSAADASLGGLDSELGGDVNGDDGELPDLLTPQNAGRMWASSMGLSFAVIPGVDKLSVTASWGRYTKSEALDEAGVSRRVWSREPVSLDKEVALDGVASYWVPLQGDGAQPEVFLAVEVRQQAGGLRVVELALVNAQEEPQNNKDTAWLFQAQLTVVALDGAQAVFAPVDDPLDDIEAHSEDPEEQHLRLLYRNELRHANGRNVAVHAEVHDGERHAHRLETRWLPYYDVPATIAPQDSEQLAGLVLSMDALAELEPAQLVTGLSPLSSGYAAWLDDREAEISELPAALRPTAEAAVFTARQIAQRIEAGIAVLTGEKSPLQADALAAFRFANEAMAMQRRHTQIVALREATGLGYAEAKAAIEQEGAKAASWRPFQLAFVLLNLAALTDPAHSERRADHTATVDLLFFPTGGGKTEAYLGLAAFTFAIRRLQGVQGAGAQARDGRAGVAVLMRYTLRLLTAQQFQRASTLVCAAEVLRQRDVNRWGTEPFRIGMWVGYGVAPNWYKDAAKQISDALDSATTKRASVLQTKLCPWCGSRIEVSAKTTDGERRRILLYCANSEGAQACRFSYVKAKGEGLPILTVDEEIYRLLPALVIATVDKMAQLPWQGYAGMLFGRVSRRCARHGYWHPDLGRRIECTGKHPKKGAQPGTKELEPVSRLRPPDLIIQDELHLISGALGTTVGLFESAVDELCTWETVQEDGTVVATGPKIVASTATTKRAAQQVRGVFGRGLAIFPPQVLEVGDTFFSRQVPVTERTPGRRYFGVCAHGVRMKSAEIRIAEILLLAGQTLFDEHGRDADPYMTLVGYFNATRELAGMRRFLDDDVTTRVRRNGHRRVRDAGALSDRLASTGMLTVQELTSRISSADITEVLKQLENSFDPELRTSARRAAIAAELRAAKKEKRAPVVPELDFERQPVDVVLATSMLQVGVDVSRFGLMMVTGQPKNTAEYIQASSRVGRDAARPGLVVTLYNWTRPRDLAHYEDFEHYHATFYRQVEALSVTPYSRRSLDRGTAAAFIAALRNAEEAHSANRAAYDVGMDSPAAERITERFLQRAFHGGGGERGQGYLAERLAVVKERWEQAKGTSARLGYQARSENKQQMAGLLQSAGNGAWTDLTVPMSMRETENEINLLVPGSISTLTQAPYGAPPWTAGAQESPPDSDTETSDDNGDEHGGTE